MSSDIDRLKAGTSPVIIVGVGVVGEVLFHACEDAGIAVAAFCDNNVNKCDQPLLDLEVIHTPTLKQRFEDATFLISAADIRDVEAQLEGLGYERWFAGRVLLRDFPLLESHYSVPLHFVEYAVNTCLLCQDSHQEPDKLFLRSVDIVITQRCTLRCKDCSNLMQYYAKPADYGVDALLRTMESFCAVVDEVNEFRVIGGEPFLHRQLHVLMDWVVQQPKIKKAVIYTNGTIVPRGDNLRSLEHDKVLVLVADYGELSRKVEPLVQTCMERGIDCHVQRISAWTDCGAIQRQGRRRQQQRQLFESCCAKNTITLMDGKLFRCPFAANAASLGAIPDFGCDHVAIPDHLGGDEQIHEVRDKIRTLLHDLSSLESCDYCNGRPFDADEITPALQIRKPLPYTPA